MNLPDLQPRAVTESEIALSRERLLEDAQNLPASVSSITPVLVTELTLPCQMPPANAASPGSDALLDRAIPHNGADSSIRTVAGDLRELNVPVTIVQTDSVSAQM